MPKRGPPAPHPAQDGRVKPDHDDKGSGPRLDPAVISPHETGNGLHPTAPEGEDMDKFTTLTGVAAPLPIVNVDTDMIIPKEYLKTIKRTGLGTGLFAEMRFNDDGTENPDFVLNKPAYRKAQILVAGDNFGCGSSPRARALGAARFRHPLRDLDELRRHLLQQLLQERHPADHGLARGPGEAVGRRRARRQRDAHDRSRGPGDPRPGRRHGQDSTSTRSASIACSTASTTSA